MQRQTLRAVVLAVLMVTSIVAGVPIGTAGATTGTETENWEYTNDSPELTQDQWPQGFAEHNGHLYVTGGETETVYELDETFTVVDEHPLTIQPSGIARYDGQWVVSSGDRNELYTYEDGFENQQLVVESTAFADTEFDEAPWDIDAHDGRLYVADAGEIAVFDSEFFELERINSPFDTTIGLHVAGGSLFLTGDAGETVYETTLEGDVLETYDIGAALDAEANGLGLYNDHWYVGDLMESNELYEFHADIDSAATVSGTVTDQDGNAVPNATVVSFGVIEDALEADPDALEAEADALLDDLENPLPESFDENYDFESHTDADVTYALVHEDRDWGVGTTHIADSSVDDPRVTVSSDRSVVLSLWDPRADGGWIENQVDQSFPGAAVEGEIEVTQLAGGGDSVGTQTFETEAIATSTGMNPLTESEHHAVETRLPVGVYEAAPADGGAGYVFTVGQPDEIASVIADEMRDDADQLTQRAERIQDLLAEETIVRETTRTDSNGEFELAIDERAVTVQIEAMRADGTVLEGVTDPSLENLREARLSEYNGSVYLPSPDGERVSVPSENVDVNVYRAPSVPLEDITSFADLQAFLESERLNETVGELQREYDQRFDEMDRARLESAYGTHRPLVETVPGAESEYLDASEFDAVRDADELARDELEREIGVMQQALASAATVDVPELEDEIDISEGALGLEYPIPDGLDTDTLAPEVHYTDGTSEVVGEEYYHVESEGWFGGSTLVLEGVPIDGEVSDVRIVGGGTDGLLDDRVPVAASPIDALQFSTLAPGVGERVSVGVDGGEVVGATVYDSDGSVLESNVSADRLRFETGSAGVYDVALTVSDGGGERVIREGLRVLENPRSEPATVRVGESGGQAYAVVGEVLESASVDRERGGTSVTAVVPGDESAIGSLHVKPDATIDVRDHDLDVAIVEGNAETSFSSHVEIVVHFDSYAEDTIAWRNSDAVKVGGGTRYGEVIRPDGGEKAVLRTYTAEDGTVTIRTVESPTRLQELWHWMDSNLPSVSWPLEVGGFVGERVVNV